MTGLLVGCAIGAYIAFKLGYYDHVIDTLIDRVSKPPLPSLNHLSCGQCFWITREMWVMSSPFPGNLIDQLIISAYCTEHTDFSWKRWNVKHLDDEGLPRWSKWNDDVDNYRGFLE